MSHIEIIGLIITASGLILMIIGSSERYQFASKSIENTVTRLSQKTLPDIYSRYLSNSLPKTLFASLALFAGGILADTASSNHSPLAEGLSHNKVVVITLSLIIILSALVAFLLMLYLILLFLTVIIGYLLSLSSAFFHSKHMNFLGVITGASGGIIYIAEAKKELGIALIILFFLTILFLEIWRNILKIERSKIKLPKNTKVIIHTFARVLFTILAIGLCSLYTASSLHSLYWKHNETVEWNDKKMKVDPSNPKLQFKDIQFGLIEYRNWYLEPTLVKSKASYTPKRNPFVSFAILWDKKMLGKLVIPYRVCKLSPEGLSTTIYESHQTWCGTTGQTVISIDLETILKKSGIDKGLIAIDLYPYNEQSSRPSQKARAVMTLISDDTLENQTSDELVELQIH